MHGIQHTSLLACLLLGYALALGLAHIPAHAVAATTQRLRLCTLVLHESPADLALPKIYLEGIGTCYKAMSRLTGEVLAGAAYSSIVITNDFLVQQKIVDIVAIRRYASEYNVRIVFLQTRYRETVQALGVMEIGEIKNSVYKGLRVGFDMMTAARDPAITDIVNDYGYWKVYRTQRPAPFIFSDESTVKVVMRYGDTDVSAFGPANGPVAAFYGTSTGQYPTEEMHFSWNVAQNELCTSCTGTTENSPSSNMDGDYTITNLALANVWFSWVTKGIFLGQRKVSLQLQIDDWFIHSGVWNTSGRVRASGDDVRQAVDWTANVIKNHDLPAGSDVRIELAYNGAGFAAWMENGIDKKNSLNLASMENKEWFNWVSHTWSHQHLDWLPSYRCNNMIGRCRTPKRLIELEILYNQLLAQGKEVEIEKNVYGIGSAGNIPATHEPFPENRYSANSIVTPEVSGLYPKTYKNFDAQKYLSNIQTPPNPGNTLALNAFKDYKITGVVGDNSRYELRPLNPHWPKITTLEEYDVAGIAIIPRHALAIPYDIQEAVHFVAYYNSENVCSQVIGTPCPEVSTFEDAMDRQARHVLFYFLQFRQDPIMLHQINLMFFPYHSTTISLTTFFADTLLYQLTAHLSKIPVTSPKMDDTVMNFRARRARDLCNYEAYVEVQGKVMVGLTTTAKAALCSSPALLTVRRDNHVTLKGASSVTEGTDRIFRIPVSRSANSSFVFEIIVNDPYVSILPPSPPPTKKEYKVGEGSGTDVNSTLEKNSANVCALSAFTWVVSLICLFCLYV